ncbi:MAG: PhoX family phosphatase, partial [Pseudomonadota bacterium]
MSDGDQTLNFDEFDECHNPPPVETDFDAVSERFLSRRRFLTGAAALGSLPFLVGVGVGLPRTADARGWLAFDPIPANTADTVTIPKGFSWHVVVSWGDPLWSDAEAFNPSTRGTGNSQERAFGDNNDGMSLFTDEDHILLTVNNEYVNRRVFFGNRASRLPEDDDDVRKGKAAHGVSVLQIAKTNGKWGAVKDSRYNRRITADTPMEITGPARGTDALKTAADPTGTTSFGTWNNCANGKTPWGTYLACEENFNGYFSSSDPNYEPSAEMKRYGVTQRDVGYAWARTDERFDISKHPNECNRAGYVVEIDPFEPFSTPKKRTALGRFKHENAEVVVADHGHVVVYLGDDERGEFLYKFVSKKKYHPDGDNADLLEDGDLYVAKFLDSGRGEWLALTTDTTGMSRADICTHTRLAGSKVGATTMDRPEWVASHPDKAEVYCSLTNNKHRGRKPNQGGDATPAGGPNPRVRNKYGQIVRWVPDRGDHTAIGFAWNLFVVAGNPMVHQDARAGTGN